MEIGIDKGHDIKVDQGLRGMRNSRQQQTRTTKTSSTDLNLVLKGEAKFAPGYI